MEWSETSPQDEGRLEGGDSPALPEEFSAAAGGADAAGGAAPGDEVPAAPAGGAAPDEALLELSPDELKKALEAVLFTASEPVAIRALADLFGASPHDIRQAVEELRSEYVETGRAFRLEDIAGGVQLLTLPAHDFWVRRLHQKQIQSRLSGAAFETLAVIAYKQPITRADLEAIRGVQCGQVVKNLLDRGLVKVVGRDESLGRPLLYGTTTRFLESFGIASLRDLPQPELLPRPREDGALAGPGDEAEDAFEPDGAAPEEGAEDLELDDDEDGFEDGEEDEGGEGEGDVGEPDEDEDVHDSGDGGEEDDVYEDEDAQKHGDEREEDEEYADGEALDGESELEGEEAEIEERLPGDR